MRRPRRQNKTDYTYLITPTYTLNLGRANLSGQFGADARYAVYDINEDQNFLTRRFSTRQRLAGGAHRARLAGAHGQPYEFQGRRQLSPDRRGRNPALCEGPGDATLVAPVAGVATVRRGWCHTRVSFRRDGEDQFTITQRLRVPSAQFRTARADPRRDRQQEDHARHSTRPGFRPDREARRPESPTWTVISTRSAPRWSISPFSRSEDTGGDS